MDLDQVLAKPQWPAVSEETATLLASHIGQMIAPLEGIRDPKDIPDLFEHVTVGFNSTMAAIETPIKPLAGVIVVRSELGPVLSEPFALASAVHGFALVQLQSHNDLQVAHGVIGVRKSLQDSLVHELFEKVGPVKSQWAYKPATMSRRKSKRPGARGAAKGQATKGKGTSNSKGISNKLPKEKRKTNLTESATPQQPNKHVRKE